jgi:hypothetical protein
MGLCRRWQLGFHLVGANPEWLAAGLVLSVDLDVFMFNLDSISSYRVVSFVEFFLFGSRPERGLVYCTRLQARDCRDTHVLSGLCSSPHGRCPRRR